MKATTATDKEVPATRQLGEHEVVHEHGIDEQGNTYEYYRCVNCAREQVYRELFTDEAVDAHKCEGGE